MLKQKGWFYGGLAALRFLWTIPTKFWPRSMLET
jgi:hypothetical protein